MLELTYLGPSWMRDENGSWHLLELTLARLVARWCEFLRGEHG